MRKFVVARLKLQREASTSLSKVMSPPKNIPKRKGTKKDDHPTKKVMG